MATLKEMCRARGLTLRELAKKIGVNYRTISGYGSGRTTKKIATLTYKKIIDFFDGEIPDDVRPLHSLDMNSALHRLRIERGISLSQLSKETGISYFTLAAIESRGITLVSKTVCTIANFFGVTVADIITPGKRNNRIISRAKQVRLKHNLTMANVIADTGFSEATIKALESRQKVTRNVIETLAKYYGVDPSELCSEYMPANVNTPSDFSQIVNDYRKAAGLTKKELAKLTGLSEATIANICNAKESAKESRLRVAKVLHIPPDKVLNFDTRYWRINDNREMATPTPEQQAALDMLKFKSIHGKLFAFEYNKQGTKEKLILKFQKLEGKYLFFTDSGGCSHTFTEQQIIRYQVRPATKQEIYQFENPLWE